VLYAAVGIACHQHGLEAGLCMVDSAICLWEGGCAEHSCIKLAVNFFFECFMWLGYLINTFSAWLECSRFK